MGEPPMQDMQLNEKKMGKKSICGRKQYYIGAFRHTFLKLQKENLSLIKTPSVCFRKSTKNEKN